MVRIGGPSGVISEARMLAWDGTTWRNVPCDGNYHLKVNPGAAPNIATNRITVMTTAVQIVAARTGRKRLTIRNTDAANDIYLGTSGVTTTTGHLLPKGQEIVLFTEAAVYGIGTTTTVVTFLEEY